MKKNEMIDNHYKNMTGKVVQSIFKLKKGSQNIYKIFNKNNDGTTGKKKTNGTAQIYLIKEHWLVNRFQQTGSAED